MLFPSGVSSAVPWQRDFRMAPTRVRKKVIVRSGSTNSTTLKEYLTPRLNSSSKFNEAGRGTEQKEIINFNMAVLKDGISRIVNKRYESA